MLLKSTEEEHATDKPEFEVNNKRLIKSYGQNRFNAEIEERKSTPKRWTQICAIPNATGKGCQIR